MNDDSTRRELWPEPRRYKIRFPDLAAFEAAAAHENVDIAAPVANGGRLYRTVALRGF